MMMIRIGVSWLTTKPSGRISIWLS